MEKTIRVTGKGTLAVKPDQIELSLTLSDVCGAYPDAVQMSSDQTMILRTSITGIGFAQDALKTEDFNIQPEYENYRDQNNDYKRKLKGYRFTHRLKVAFPVDNERLGQIFTALSASSLHPEISIEYTVKDSEAVKNALLKNAVDDASAKAKILASAAGVTLKDILLIDYSWADIEISSRSVDNMALPEGTGFQKMSLNIDPEDINLEDTVTVVWGI